MKYYIIAGEHSGDCKKLALICPSKWCTGQRGTFNLYANDFAVADKALTISADDLTGGEQLMVIYEYNAAEAVSVHVKKSSFANIAVVSWSTQNWLV